MIAPATAQNPAVLLPYQIAELRHAHGRTVDDLIAEGVIVEKKESDNNGINRTGI